MCTLSKFPTFTFPAHQHRTCTYTYTVFVKTGYYCTNIPLSETGTLVLSQYILLDPPLLFFIMAATYCTARFINCRDE